MKQATSQKLQPVNCVIPIDAKFENIVFSSEKNSQNEYIKQHIRCKLCEGIARPSYYQCEKCICLVCQVCVAKFADSQRSICASNGKSKCEFAPFPKFISILTPVKNELTQIKIKCPSYKNPTPEYRCNQNLQMSEYEHHIQECPKILIECKYSGQGCNQRVPKSKVEEHVANCEYKQVTCQFCQCQILLKDRQYHYSQCPNLTECVTCQQKQPTYLKSYHKQLCDERHTIQETKKKISFIVDQGKKLLGRINELGLEQIQEEILKLYKTQAEINVEYESQMNCYEQVLKKKMKKGVKRAGEIIDETHKYQEDIVETNKAISKSKQVYENMRGILERYNKKQVELWELRFQILSQTKCNTWNKAKTSETWNAFYQTCIDKKNGKKHAIENIRNSPSKYCTDCYQIYLNNCSRIKELDQQINQLRKQGEAYGLEWCDPSNESVSSKDLNKDSSIIQQK